MSAVAVDALVERDLALQVDNTKHALLMLLTPEQRRSRHASAKANPEVRVEAWTFEDSAQLLAQDDETVRNALRAYQQAVNAMWLYMHSCNVAEKFAAMWRRKHRSVASLVPREDVEAEVLFRLRDAIRRFDPHRGTRFIGFAPNVIFGDLVEWARAQQSVVSRPRDTVLRKTTPPADTEHTRDPDMPGTDAYRAPHRSASARPQQLGYRPDENVLLELIDEDRANDAT
jgi:hypothetical protein